MTPEAVESAAGALCAARQNRVRVDRLLYDCLPPTIDEAYNVQDALIRRLARPVYGWKVGATSQKARDFVGINDSSLKARMLAPNCYNHPAGLAGHFFFMRALECEFAFSLGTDLPAAYAPYDEAQVLSAVENLHPAIEISDSRYTDWTTVGGPALVADNCNDGAFVRGNAIADWRDTDLTRHEVSLFINDEWAASGSGAEVITGPVGILVWLANELARTGSGLEAGQTVTTGSCTGVVMACAGDRVRAEFGSFGRVTLTF